MSSRNSRRAHILELQKAEELRKFQLQRLKREAAARCKAGTGSLSDFRLIAAHLMDDECTELLPSLIIHRARRECRLRAPAWHDLEKWTLVAAQVLSFLPGEQLDVETELLLEELDEVLADTSINAELRIVASTARLMIGEGHGVERRKWCWEVMDAAGRARDEVCNPDVHKNKVLIDCWSEVERAFARYLVEHDLIEDPEEPLGITSYNNYAAFMYLIAEEKAAKNGQNRSSEAQDETSG